MILWELFGPGEEDYRFLNRDHSEIRIDQTESVAEVEIRFTLNRPGNYRLRVATVDLAGRTAVAWGTVTVPSEHT